MACFGTSWATPRPTNPLTRPFTHGCCPVLLRYGQANGSYQGQLLGTECNPTLVPRWPWLLAHLIPSSGFAHWLPALATDSGLLHPSKRLEYWMLSDGNAMHKRQGAGTDPATSDDLFHPLLSVIERPKLVSSTRVWMRLW
jgi:hypothetical protein